MQWLVMCLTLSAAALVSGQTKTAEWPQWRGPYNTGMAEGDAPLKWDDHTNVRWKVEIPGRGHSTPVIAGDRLFLTTAVPTGKGTPPRARGRAGGGADAGLEHRFKLLAIDRGTGRIAWQRTTTVATPHEGYHRVYGSFASNSPVTDGVRVFAFLARAVSMPTALMAHCSGRKTSGSRCGWTWPSAKALR